MHQRSSPRATITIVLTVVAGLLAALTGVLGNLATSSIPPILTPYLRFAWPAFGIAVVLGTVIAVVQVRRAALTSSSNSPQPKVSTQQQKKNSKYHTCVLSYALEDKAFAEKLYADLQQQGVSCWFAEHDLKAGDKLKGQIYEAIQKKDKLLLILSEHAIKNTWVEREVELAFEQEDNQNGQLILFPIRIDDAIRQTSAPWAGDIRRMRFIADFRLWQDEPSYQKAFQRLLGDLHT